MKHELTSKDLTWTNVQSPEAEELADFIRASDLHAHDAEFVAQRYHRPGITVRAAYVLILIHVPVFNRQLRLTQGASLFLVVREGHLFTLHYDPIVALDKIRHDLEVTVQWQEEVFGGGAMELCLTLIGLLYESGFRKLERLAKHIDIAEDAVFQGNERKMVEEVSLLTRDVMDFRKLIRPQRSLFTQLPQHALMTPDEATTWGRVDGQLRKMWDMLESMFESVRELSSTNFTLLQHKENELLRLLTIYSIVVIPMLIVTDPLFNPRAGDATLVDDLVFWVVLGLLVLTLGLVLLRVRNKRLL